MSLFAILSQAWSNVSRNRTLKNLVKLCAKTLRNYHWLKREFDEYILIQSKKTGRKIKALARVCMYLSLKRRRTLMKAFIESQFAYCPLTWMFCQRSSNTWINHLHKRALRIVYDNNESTFEDLLKKDNSVPIHHKNIQLLGIELYKVKKLTFQLIWCLRFSIYKI